MKRPASRSRRGALSDEQLDLLGRLDELGDGDNDRLGDALRGERWLLGEVAAPPAVNLHDLARAHAHADGHVHAAVGVDGQVHGLLDRVCACCHRFASLAPPWPGLYAQAMRVVLLPAPAPRRWCAPPGGLLPGSP